MSCCSNHFSTFAVQKVAYGSGITKPATPLFYCTMVNVILIILVLVGKFLDKRKLLLFSLKGSESDQVKDEEAPAANAGQVEM